MSIAESIEASNGTEFVPVTFEACGDGELLVAGRPSNYQAGRISNHVYFASLLEPAVWAAELAVALTRSEAQGRIYVVEPTGPFEDDPNVTDKKFPGNVTRSCRTRHPMRVLDQVRTWEGLRAQGLDLIEDQRGVVLSGAVCRSRHCISSMRLPNGSRV